MPFAVHNRILIEGTLATAGGVTGDIFVFGLADSSGVEPATLAPELVDPIQTWFHAAGNYIDDKATLTAVRVQQILADGKVGTSYSASADAVGSASTCMPYICCACITLTTDEFDPKGKRILGRIFPPNTGWPYLGNGLGTGYGLNIAQSGAELVTALNEAGATICVASQTGAGINATVTGCSADNIVDTQRRRKNASIGARGSQAVPYTP